MQKKDLRIVFMGTPEFAVATLRGLQEEGYNVVCVVTQPDKAVGRHQDTKQMPPVKRYALSQGLPVLQPERMKDAAFQEQLRSYKADLQVVVAFRMLPEAVFQMPRFGTFNVHAALLPDYRGAAPINWAIINGERKTGVTTFFLDKDIDTGQIIMQRETPIDDKDNVETLYNRLMTMGRDIALNTIDRLLEGDGSIKSTPQRDLLKEEGQSSAAACMQGETAGTACQTPGTLYETPRTLHKAPKIFKETCQADTSLPQRRVYNFIRGLSPVPGAWVMAELEQGKPSVFKIYEAEESDIPVEKCGVLEAQSANVTPKESGVSESEDEQGNAPKLAQLRPIGKDLYLECGDFCLKLLIVQPAGKKRMSARDFLNGWKR